MLIQKEGNKESMTGYVQPEEIIIIDKLPLTPIGKIDYRELENRVKTD